MLDLAVGQCGEDVGKVLLHEEGRMTIGAMNVKVAVIAFVGFAISMARAELPSGDTMRKADGPTTHLIIEKAYGLLSTTRVFATTCVGAGGTPTKSCWALSVIVNHDKDAEARLAKRYQEAIDPAERLYIIAGLIAIGESKHRRLRPWLFPRELRAAKVNVIDACSEGVSTFGDRAALLFARGSAAYVFGEVPAIAESSGIAPRPSPKK